MPLHNIPEKDLRDHCRRIIESLELWLRRLIDDRLSEKYGSNYIDAKRADGSFVIKNEIRKTITKRLKQEPERFSRPIDAAQLDHKVSIICNSNLYNECFKEAFNSVFPNGRSEAHLFLKRLIEPRNRLGHANPISIRQAERVVCYSNDVIEALKFYYQCKGLEMRFNVPMINRVTDSFGRTFFANEINRNSTGRGVVDRRSDQSITLRSGDTISLEVEVDAAYDRNSYVIRWVIPYGGDIDSGQERVSITLTNGNISPEFVIYCHVTSKKHWHRLGNIDDQIGIIYEVLPPIDG
jgi:hypothetical protein